MDPFFNAPRWSVVSPSHGLWWIYTLLLTAVLIGALACESGSQREPTSAATRGTCADEPRLRALAFWIGEWNVYVAHELVGTNRIQPILKGCAVEERWRDVAGNEGRSLFYLDPSTHRLKQVWVTESALLVGGTKEKTEQIEFTTSTRIRFQGSYPGPDGADIADRTTLTLQHDGSLRHLIETSADGGKTWRVRVDLVCRRQGADVTADPARNNDDR